MNITINQIHNNCCAINKFIGEKVAWLTIIMVVIQFFVVLLRYVFGFGSVFLQESILYLHATIFLCGAGYTLLQDAHVRVDAFYHKVTWRSKAWINLLGCVGFLGPFITVLFFYSWPYVTASWMVFEGSRETTGIPAVFLLKSLILVYCLLLMIQCVAMGLHAIGQLLGDKDDA
jgi:TRAP-type mannitol/chloroaromatic compound transport system permease small subunit